MTEEIYLKAQELRHAYRSCIKLANETDSKKEDVYLRAEAKNNLEELKKICPHKDVAILYSEYVSYNSYEDGGPERRICLCCSLTETKSPRFREQFEHLKDENLISRIEHDRSPQINNPLDYLLNECQEIALNSPRIKWK